MSEPAPATPSSFRLLLQLREAAEAGDAGASKPLGRAKLAAKILLGLFALNFLQSCSTLWREGPVFADTPITVQAGDQGGEAVWRVNIERAMNTVRLNIHNTGSNAISSDFALTITDPAGEKIETVRFWINEDRDGWITGSMFDVKRDGEHEVRIKASGSAPASEVATFRLRFNRNATKGHFISHSMLLALGAWLTAVWWRRTQALPWWNRQQDRAALAGAAPVAMVAGVGPDPAAAESPPEPSPLLPARTAPQTTSALSAPFQAPAAPPTWHHIPARLVVEALMVGVSIVRLPILGAYTMLIIIGVFWVAGGVGGASLGAAIGGAMKSPGVVRVLEWIVPQGHYQGMAALEALGFAALKVLLPFHVIGMIVRAFRRKAEPLPLKVRLKRLLRWNLALLALFAIGAALMPRQPGTDYLEMVFGIAGLIGIVFVPAAVLLAISAGLEQVADSFADRSSDHGQ